jgi:hypothetical protein
MDEHTAHIVPGHGWGNAVPILVRVRADGPVDGEGTILVEASLGLSWGAKGPPRAWTELARRADVALAAHGYVRTVEWQPHVYPHPIAAAKVSRVPAR